MRQALQDYLALAAGAAEVTRQRALAAAKALVSSGEARADQVVGLADDLMASSRRNSEALGALVRFEVERAMGKIGLATSDDITALGRRIEQLEAALAEAPEAPAAGGPAAGGPAAGGPAAGPPAAGGNQ